MDKAPPDSSFDFVLKVLRESNNEIELEACSKWTEKDQESGMAVMDIEIPSGFELDWDKVQRVNFKFYPCESGAIVVMIMTHGLRNMYWGMNSEQSFLGDDKDAMNTEVEGTRGIFSNYSWRPNRL